MRVVAVVLVAVLLAVPTLAQRSSPAVPVGEKPGGPGSTGGGPIQGQWAHSPGLVGSDGTFGLFAPEGKPIKVWLRLTTSAPIDEDVQILTSSPVAVNRTTARVTLAAGASTSVPFEITMARSEEPTSGSLQAGFNRTRDDGGRPVTIVTNVEGVPPVSIRFTSPKVEYQDFGYGAQPIAVHVGYKQTVPFDIVARNPFATASTAGTYVLHAYGRQLAQVTIPALAPGENKTIHIMDFLLTRDMAEYAPVGDFGYAATIDFQLTPSADLNRGYRPVYRYDVVDGRLANLQMQSAHIAFHSGVLAEAKNVNVTLGKPSYIDVEVTNWGDETASNIRVDVRASPVPAAYYGEGSYIQETFYVSVGPEETKHINVTFTPRVAGALQVTVEPYISGYSQPIQRTFDLYTPVTVTPRETLPVVVATKGDSVKVTFTVNSSVNLTGARVLFAVTDDSAAYSGVVPYVRFVTADDIVSASPAPAQLDLRDDKLTWINATLDLRAAGFYRIVPYLQVGDLAYVGRVITTNPDGGGEASVIRDGPGFSGSGMPGNYELRVQPGPFSVAGLWMPLGAVIVGFVGYWVFRRQYVL